MPFSQLLISKKNDKIELLKCSEPTEGWAKSSMTPMTPMTKIGGDFDDDIDWDEEERSRKQRKQDALKKAVEEEEEEEDDEEEDDESERRIRGRFGRRPRR